MVKYRKRPVVVEAFQMTREAFENKASWPDWVRIAWRQAEIQIGWNGYWIINDNGHLSTRSPEDFAAEFEPVEDER